jgi:hypothetical protein
MGKAGIAAIVEPAFWLGQPRTHVGTFEDYFASLLGWERFRASQFGMGAALSDRRRSERASSFHHAQVGGFPLPA